MNPNAIPTSRRQFLAASGAAALGLWGAALAQSEATAYKTQLKRAMILQKPNESNMRALKEAGFDGFEGGVVPEDEAARAREIAEKLGLKIHSVIGGGNDPAAVLNAAHGYGADTVLLVVGRIDLGQGSKKKKGGQDKAASEQKKIKVPEPWEFDIEIDEKTGHLKRVVKGDNAPYADYIAAYDRCLDDAVALVKSHIPLAEKLGVTIALENVWASPWNYPEQMIKLVDLCGSKQVMTYFDVGNQMKYGLPPEVWIRKLGQRIRRIHIKDWLYSDDKKSGKFVHPREGSIEWPKVRQAIEEVGYNGFLTIEDGGLELPEFRKRLDLIIAGK